MQDQAKLRSCTSLTLDRVSCGGPTLAVLSYETRHLHNRGHRRKELQLLPSTGNPTAST